MPIAYDPPEDEAVRVGLEGWDLTHCVTASALVAVTRYDTGPDRWRALKDYLNDVIKATSVDAEVWEGNLVVAALEARAASRPACPPSSVHDMIVAGEDQKLARAVRPGDISS